MCESEMHESEMRECEMCESAGYIMPLHHPYCPCPLLTLNIPVITGRKQQVVSMLAIKKMESTGKPCSVAAQLQC